MLHNSYKISNFADDLMKISRGRTKLLKSVPRLSGTPSCAPIGAQAQAEGSKESKKNKDLKLKMKSEKYES